MSEVRLQLGGLVYRKFDSTPKELFILVDIYPDGVWCLVTSLVSGEMSTVMLDNIACWSDLGSDQLTEVDEDREHLPVGMKKGMKELLLKFKELRNSQESLNNAL